MVLKLGVARKDITPQVGCNLYGYYPDLYATTLHDPLDVTALVFAWDEKKAAMISATVCLINTQLADEIRARIESETGIPADNVIIAATHTHTGPNTAGSFGWGEIDRAYCNGTLYDFNNQVLSGFQQAASEAGIALYPNRFQIKMGHARALEEGLEKAMAGPTKPTAIFCAVDFYALKVLRYLYEQGYRVPEDISVVGIDDVSISHLITPALTTVRIDRDRMIREGLEMLDAMRRGEKCESRMLSAPKLMIRQTTAPVREIPSHK